MTAPVSLEVLLARELTEVHGLLDDLLARLHHLPEHLRWLPVAVGRLGRQRPRQVRGPTQPTPRRNRPVTGVERQLAVALPLLAALSIALLAISHHYWNKD